MRFTPTPPFITITFILFVLTLGIHFHLFSNNDTNHGEPSPPDPVTTEPPGVGLDLTGFYGTVAVSFPNGTTMSIGRVEGSSHYEEVIRRLSLWSSCHLHPPYQEIPDKFLDLPRETLRSMRKSIGLPASGDVGALATMIQKLQVQAEDALGVPLATVPFFLSTPPLPALYAEDILDAFEYLSLPFPKGGWRGSWAWVRDTGAALAGYGRFLCSDYRDYEACKSEIDRMPSIQVLSILYTEKGLKILQTGVHSAHAVAGFWDDEERWTLGHALRGEEGYWDRVAVRLMDWKRNWPGSRTPELILLFGESSADDTFRSVLQNVFVEEFGSVPEILGGSDEYVVARGAAEFARVSFFGVH
ncbi:hypothetical protein CDV55_103035 [Aspergillus turcosus]|nr:hypothetical protein CDV55_103035 [Aspergillus turcosus]